MSNLWGNEEVSKIKKKLMLTINELKTSLISVSPTDSIAIAGMQAKIRLLEELLIEIDTIEKGAEVDD